MAGDQHKPLFPWSAFLKGYFSLYCYITHTPNQRLYGDIHIWMVGKWDRRGIAVYMLTTLNVFFLKATLKTFLIIGERGHAVLQITNWKRIKGGGDTLCRRLSWLPVPRAEIQQQGNSNSYIIVFSFLVL